MEDSTKNPLEGTELESLESSPAEVEKAGAVINPSTPDSPGSAEGSNTAPTGDKDTASGDTPPPANNPEPPKPSRWAFVGGLRRRFQFFNIYLLFFVLVVIIATAVGIVAYLQGKHSGNGSSSISSQTLDQKALEQLANTDATVGSANQVLNVQSNAIFAGKVLVRDSLEVAGGLQIGGNLSLAGVTVSGSSSFGQVQVNKNLAVVGDTALQGILSVQKSLNVNGSGTFNGALSATQLTASSLQLNGDLTLTHHLVVGGPTPGRSNGGALGSGGTASVSGSDTGGSVTINTGSGTSAGCFITVNFVNHFNATPHVLVTPVGASAGSLAYYVNRSTTSFSICDASNPPNNTSFGFDYLVLD